MGEWGVQGRGEGERGLSCILRHKWMWHRWNHWGCAPHMRCCCMAWGWEGGDGGGGGGGGGRGGGVLALKASLDLTESATICCRRSKLEASAVELSPLLRSRHRAAWARQTGASAAATSGSWLPRGWQQCAALACIGPHRATKNRQQTLSRLVTAAEGDYGHPESTPSPDGSVLEVP